MSPNQTSQSRANEVWRRFTGMFGGEALERKYGKTIPPEWTAILSRLKDFEIDRGLRRLAYSGKATVPSLPEFVRLCRMVGHDDVDEGPVRHIALPSPDAGTFDRWAIESNQHLLGYMLRRANQNARAFGTIPTCVPGRDKCYSAEQEVAAKILVGYKNAWAQDMREWGIDPATGEMLVPTPDERRASWESCMRLAEQDIAALSAKAAA